MFAPRRDREKDSMVEGGRRPRGRGVACLTVDRETGPCMPRIRRRSVLREMARRVPAGIGGPGVHAVPVTRSAGGDRMTTREGKIGLGMIERRRLPRRDCVACCTNR